MVLKDIIAIAKRLPPQVSQTSIQPMSKDAQLLISNSIKTSDTLLMDGIVS